jgi:hypothetical protein
MQVTLRAALGSAWIGMSRISRTCNKPTSSECWDGPKTSAALSGKDGSATA